MKTIQDMIDNHEEETYSGGYSVDAEWIFYADDRHPSVILRVFFSASDMVDRFTAHMSIDRDDALERVLDMVDSVTSYECLGMPFDVRTDYAGEEALFTDIISDYNGEDMDELNLKFDPAVERVAYYAARIEDPDLR